jgi:hypothetical protein
MEKSGPRVKFLAGGLALALLGPAADAQSAIIVFNNNLAGYLLAAGGDDLYLDFETDSNGFPVVTGNADLNGIPDVLGSIFSSQVTYSSPDHAGFPARVNISDINQGIDNEIGPMGAWTGTLRWDYGGLCARSGQGSERESNVMGAMTWRHAPVRTWLW